MKRAAIIAAGIIVGGAAANAARNDAQETLSHYERTGESVDCLPLRNIRETKPVSDYALFVQGTGGAYYINEFDDRCFNLAREKRYVHNAVVPRMCKGDVIRVLDSSGSRGSSCVIGAFEELVEIPDPH